MTEDEIRDILLTSNTITAEELEKAGEEQQKLNQPLEKVLIGMKIVEKDALYNLMAERLNVKYRSLEGLSVSEDIVKIYPEDLSRSTRSVPLMVKDEVLHIAMEDPTDVSLIDQVQLLLIIRSRFILRKDDIAAAADKIYSEAAGIFSASQGRCGRRWFGQ